jgi:hypothetical protein
LSTASVLPKKSGMKKRWPWIGLVVAAVIGAALVVAHERSATPGTAVAAAASGPMTGTMGKAVTQDGTLSYTVSALDCTSAVSGAVAKGHFCTVAITVRNLSGAARKPGISFAHAYDAQGAGYLADALAEIRSGSLLLDELAAGKALSDRLIYDVPAGKTLTSVVLRESPSSAGIRIALT